MRVGFIGLGKMGRPMAENLLKASHTLTVHNRSRGVVRELVGLGANEAWSPREVALASEFVFTCLPTPPVVEEVLLGKDGAIEGAKAGDTFMDMSTTDPATHKRIAAETERRGVAYLDAPVSGGPAGAQGATLSIMVGGTKEAFAKCLPLFQVLGKNIYHVGPVGSGSVVKLVNNLILAINRSAIFEGLVLGTKAGVDPRTLLEIIGASTAASRTMEGAGPKILAGDFEPGFTVDFILKDVGLALDMGEDIGVRLLAGSQAFQIFQEARDMGLGARDFSAGIVPLERLAGVEVRAKGE